MTAIAGKTDRKGRAEAEAAGGGGWGSGAMMCQFSDPHIISSSAAEAAVTRSLTNCACVGISEMADSMPERDLIESMYLISMSHTIAPAVFL